MLFCSCDLDLDIRLDDAKDTILEIYLHTINDLSISIGRIFHTLEHYTDVNDWKHYHAAFPGGSKSEALRL